MLVIKLIGGLVGFLVLLCGSLLLYVRYLKRNVPMPSLQGIADIYGKEADRRFAKLDGRMNGLFVLFTVAAGMALFLLLRLFGQWRTAQLPPALLTFPVSSAFFALIAMFAGMGIAGCIVLPLAKRWWPESQTLYLAYASHRRYGCDYTRLCRGLFLGVTLLAAAGVPFGLNNYVQVRRDALVVHRMLALHERSHAFSEIDRILTAPAFVAPNGRIRHQRDYVVYFKDGSKWVAGDLPSGEEAERVQIAELLSKQSGVPIQQVPIFQTADLYD